MFSDLVVQFLGLAGVAALIAALINALKSFGYPDGYASKLSAALSVLAFAVMSYFQIFAPEISVWELDEIAGVWAERLLYILGFIVQIGLPAKFHEFLKNGNIPFLGYSYSKEYDDLWLDYELDEE